MPPRTRTTKATKPLKENIGISTKTKLKADKEITKPQRKILGDKTNSASDDNASFEAPKKTSKKPTVTNLEKSIQNDDNVVRPRRDRRVPSRFVENQLLKNLNNKENSSIPVENKNKNNVKQSTIVVAKDASIDLNDPTDVSPFKTPQKVADVSLMNNRPRRVSRLPSRFEDHSVSPSKFIPVQPCHASTPLARKTVKAPNKDKTTGQNVHKRSSNDNSTPKVEQKKPTRKKVTEKNTDKVISDTNNNAQGRTLRTRRNANTDVKPPKSINHSKGRDIKNPVQIVSPVKKKISPVKHSSPIKISSPVKHSYLMTGNNAFCKKQLMDSPVKPFSASRKPTLRKRRDLSFRVLEDHKKNEINEDIYEFTYDPNEEPAPLKKKRHTVKRKPADPKPKTVLKMKPKTVVFKMDYDKNVNKALAVLKKVVNSKTTQKDEVAQQPNLIETSKNIKNKQQTQIVGSTSTSQVKTLPQVQRDVASKIVSSNTSNKPRTNQVRSMPLIQQNIILKPQPAVISNAAAMQVAPYASKPSDAHQSIRVEDIAADFENSPQHDIDYSPINTPVRPMTPVNQIRRVSDNHHQDDPLNLKENFSFDENPIASSSMNCSVKHPHASPWRVEFESLPIRWHVNSYVKSNMTPAFECSFVNFDDKNTKKHVYTNLVPESNDPLPEIVQKDQNNLIQSSIISFVKEVLERSSTKKKRGRSTSPVSASLFNDVKNKTPNKDENLKKSTKQLFTPIKNTNKIDTSNDNSTNDSSNDKENSKNSSKGQKRKNDEEPNDVPAKTPRKDKDDRYFGFDDSENIDLENVSPQKNTGRMKSLRPRARAVLKEINAQAGPTRAMIPVAAKTARRTEVEKLYDEMKSASDAPELPDKELVVAGGTNVTEPTEELNEDSQTSVHLFEDIDVVHHFKQPQRKSYGKAKKVTFARKLSTDSDTQDSDMRPQPNESDEEEDLDDITFDPGLPLIEEERKKTKKKQAKRNKMTKKEAEAAEAWAAGFNSMCEDVEDFPLLVE